MEQNIYSLQNDIDLAKYVDNYLIQALANLGQRVGIKGDGIKNLYFTIEDAMSYYDADHDNNVGVIYCGRTNDIDTLYIGTLKNEDVDTFTTSSSSIANVNIKVSTTDIKDYLSLESFYELANSINNIEVLHKNSIIHNNGKTIQAILLGKYFGRIDNDSNNSEYIYIDYDIVNYKPLHMIRAYHKSGTIYVGTKIEYIDNNKYVLTIQEFDSRSLETYQKYFENLFSFTNKHEQFNPIDISKTSYEDMMSYNQNIAMNESNSALSIIFNHVENKNQRKPFECILDYNVDRNVRFSADIPESNNVYYKNAIETFSNIDTYLVSEIINLFSNRYYTYNSSTLFIKILTKIYEKITENIGYKPLYVPLDFKFKYIANSNNTKKIYYTENIYVEFNNLKSYEDVEGKISSLTNPMIDCSDESTEQKIVMYNFNIDYNEKFDILNNISVNTLYTLPYINSYNNWSINNEDTMISAIGKDAGNPNIIIVYSNYDNESHEILNSISNQEKLSGLEWKTKDIILPYYLFNNNVSDVVCKCFVPVVTTYNLKYLKDSLLVIVSSKSSVLDDTETLQNSYIGNNIVTMWTLDYDYDNVPQYSVILDKDNTTIGNTKIKYPLLLSGSSINYDEAASSSSLYNQTNIINNDILLLNTNPTYDGSLDSYNSELDYLILKNKNAEEYNDILKDDELMEQSSSNQYANDLNFIFQYNDNIELSSSGKTLIHSQKNDKKYLSSFNDMPITNCMYKYPIIVYEEQNNSNTISTILSTTSNDTVIDIRQGQISYSSTSNETTGISNAYTSNTVVTSYVEKHQFNEYLFNSNVPSLDLKEILMTNANIMNRVNVLTLSNDKNNIYYSYLGSSFEDNNKSVLHIGSSNININIGSDTLIDEKLRTQFSKQETISIDFDKIILNANSVVSPPALSYQIVGDTKYFSTTINPIGKKYYANQDKELNMYIGSDNYVYAFDFIDNDVVLSDNNEQLFCNVIDMNHAIYPEYENQEIPMSFKDASHSTYIAIHLNKLFKHRLNVDLISPTITNKNDIISIKNGDGTYQYWYICNRENLKYVFDNMMYYYDTLHIICTIVNNSVSTLTIYANDQISTKINVLEYNV